MRAKAVVMCSDALWVRIEPAVAAAGARFRIRAAAVDDRLALLGICSCCTRESAEHLRRSSASAAG